MPHAKKPLFDPGISYFARSNFREYESPFGIYQKDRLFHMYLLGKTGSGKSTLLKNLILQDIFNERGICVFDIHNDLIPDIFQNIPAHIKDKILYLDLTNPELPFHYNPLRPVSPSKRSLVASGILESFQMIWGAKAWGPKMEHILRATLLSLLDQPSAKLADIRRILLDDSFRQKCICHIQNAELVDFWKREFPKMAKADILPILNKVTALLAHPILQNFLSAKGPQLSLRSVMDKKQVLLVNLSRGHLGADAAYLIGSFLIHALRSAAFSRADMPEDTRHPFFIYMDEFHFYTTPGIIEILSELRKFKVGLICAHQYLSQISPEIRDALLGNAGSLCCFRLSQSDAKFFQQEFFPVFHHSDFTSLANYDIYLRLMICGKPSPPFSATTLPFPLYKK